MKVSEALNLYSLHSNPKQLKGYDKVSAMLNKKYQWVVATSAPEHFSFKTKTGSGTASHMLREYQDFLDSIMEDADLKKYDFKDVEDYVEGVLQTAAYSGYPRRRIVQFTKTGDRLFKLVKMFTPITTLTIRCGDGSSELFVSNIPEQVFAILLGGQ